MSRFSLLSFLEQQGEGNFALRIDVVDLRERIMGRS